MTRRGSVAFHYGGALTEAQLEWFGRFDVLVTHDPLPPAQVQALRGGGTRLALYEWTVAFYRLLVRRGTWQERLLRENVERPLRENVERPLEGHAALLNRRALRGHAGASDADAFYYDPAHPDFPATRTRAITARLQETGYDGLFFDTTTFESVHPDALAEYRRRHPELSYDAAFARFLAALRESGALIVTNQGYRDAEHYLPYADYDITESLLVRPWHDPSNRWNSVDFLMPELILKTAARFPHVRFVHLNYIEAPGRHPEQSEGSQNGTSVQSGDPSPSARLRMTGVAERIETILATARLYDHDAFVAHDDVTRTVFSDLYFVDLGRPTSEIRTDGLTATRTFECGTVTVTPERAKIGRALP